MMSRGVRQELPEEVYVVGFLLDSANYHTPFRDRLSDFGLAPLKVLDADGEWALPVFTTLRKAGRGICHFTTEEERTGDPVGMALVGLDDLLKTMAGFPEGDPRLDYIGFDMGEGGIYPLIRL